MKQSVTEKLNSLGIQIPASAPPLGAYVPAVYVPTKSDKKMAKGQIWTSGQLPLLDGTLLHPGALEDEVSIEEGAKCAAQCFINALAALSTVGFSVEHVVRVLKITGYVHSRGSFYQQPAVINGASELAHQIFGESGVHARSAVGVSHLPMNSCVELEVIFEVQQSE